VLSGHTPGGTQPSPSTFSSFDDFFSDAKVSVQYLAVCAPHGFYGEHKLGMYKPNTDLRASNMGRPRCCIAVPQLYHVQAVLHHLHYSLNSWCSLCYIMPPATSPCFSHMFHPRIFRRSGIWIQSAGHGGPYGLDEEFSIVLVHLRNLSQCCNGHGMDMVLTCFNMLRPCLNMS
jgi:hypothetical protein